MYFAIILVVCKVRRDTQAGEGTSLLNLQAGNGAWVRAPLSPPYGSVV